MGMNKPFVLFLHGWGFDKHVWKDAMLRLSKDCDCLAIDLPGHGQSNVEDNAHFLQSISHKIPANCTVVGWSLGGMYALKLASLFPNLIRQVIMVASSPRFLKEDSWPGIDPVVLSQFYARYHKAPHETVKKFIMLQTIGVSDFDYNIPESPNLMMGLDILKYWDLRACLQSLQASVHFLLGRKDAIVPSALKHALTHSYVDTSCTVWPKAAHMPFASDPERFTDYILEKVSWNISS